MAGRRTSAPKAQPLAQTPKVSDARVQRALDVLQAAVVDLQSRAHDAVLSGHGSPEGVVAADIGTLYRDLDGGPNATLYVKENGDSSTGWVAK